MKVPKSIRFLTKRGKDKEEKELRKWSSNPDLKNKTVPDGFHNPPDGAKRRKTRGHTRNISSPSALASIKSKIQEVKIIENEYSKPNTVLKADKTKEKASRPLPTRTLSVVHEVSPSLTSQLSTDPSARSCQQTSYNNIFILGLLFTCIGFNSAWLFEELLQQHQRTISIELSVFSVGILLLPFMKFRKRAIVFLSLALQVSLLCLQFGKLAILETFGDCFEDSYILVKASVFSFSIFNIAFGTIYEFLR